MLIYHNSCKYNNSLVVIVYRGLERSRMFSFWDIGSLLLRGKEGGASWTVGVKVKDRDTWAGEMYGIYLF